MAYADATYEDIDVTEAAVIKKLINTYGYGTSQFYAVITGEITDIILMDDEVEVSDGESATIMAIPYSEDGAIYYVETKGIYYPITLLRGSKIGLGDGVESLEIDDDWIDRITVVRYIRCYYYKIFDIK